MEKETNKLSRAEVSIKDDAPKNVTLKKVDELECNKEGVSEEEDIEEGTSGDDEEGSEERESDDESVLEEKTRMDIRKKVKCSDFRTPEPNLGQIFVVNCLMIEKLKVGCELEGKKKEIRKHEFKPGNAFVRYCECFAPGIYCDGCNYVNYHNNVENEATKREAIEATLERNLNASRPKKK
ncbi:hypothetical protein U1Q18_001594 [Sarracenia purpurea var. burkii]